MRIEHDPRSIVGFAREVLDSHGLSDWSVQWDRAKRRAGSCSHSRTTVTLSKPLAMLYPEEVMRAVVLHEVAHALAGPDHQHDEYWKKIARALGAPPQASLPSALPQPPPLWRGKCPRCAQEKGLHSMPRRVVSCGRCSSSFRADLILEWTCRGEPTHPSGRYAQELRRIRLLSRSKR